jgi:DNA-binding CsgD family transcriptional regulator
MWRRGRAARVRRAGIEGPDALDVRRLGVAAHSDHRPLDAAVGRRRTYADPSSGVNPPFTGGTGPVGERGRAALLRSHLLDRHHVTSPSTQLGAAAVLSERDLGRVAGISRALLSPFDSPSLDSWCARVESELVGALGADVMAFSLPALGQSNLYLSTGTARWVFDTYMHESLPALERQWGVKRRLVQLGVSSRRMLYATRLPEYYRSVTWNEVIVPGRAFDTIAMAGSVEKGQEAFLFLIHANHTGRKFGAAGLAKLQLLYPSFMAGVRAVQHVANFDGSLLSLVDAMPSALALGDDDGRLVHLNVAMQKVLESEVDRLALLAALQRFLVRLAHTGRDPGFRRVALPRAVGRNGIDLGECRYRFGGARLGGSRWAAGASMLVTVERFGPPMFPADALRARGITPRELEIVRRVASGMTSPRIAEQLGISRFTVRHHLESIMRKLGVHTRGAVGAAVAELARESDRSPH